MSLRYRLFLWVSALFLLTAVAGAFFESIVTKRELKKAKQTLCEKIVASKEIVRRNLQEFVSYQVMEDQAKIDVLLNTISYSTPQLIRFAPTLENARDGTAMACADLLAGNRWIDFIQNTNESVPTGVIVPESPPFKHAFRIPIDQDLSWVFYPDALDQSLIGVRLFAIDQEYPKEHLDGEEIEELIPIIPETYLVFPTQSLVDAEAFTLSKEGYSLNPPWIQGHRISLAPFLDAMKRAQKGLKEHTLIPPQIDAGEIEKKLSEEGAWEEMLVNPFPNVNMIASMPNEKFLREKMNDLSMRNGEINILWMLQSLMHSGMFGPVKTDSSSGFGIPTPVAISTFKMDLSTGPAAWTKNLFFSSQLFDDAAYFHQNAPSAKQSNIAMAIAIIDPAMLSHVYLGNTAQFHVKTAEQSRVGYLTVGCDADTIIQELVLTLHQTVFLVTGGKVASAFSAEEEKIPTSTGHDVLVSDLLNQKVGVTTWEGKEYFFMHLIPFPHLDLHFFLFNPTEIEFALLHNLEEGSQKVADSIFFNIQICGLIVLGLSIIFVHYFAKSITAPIIQLASSAQNVKEGNLDQVHISLPSTKRKDEIATLCHSFDEMVQGLKEKEKVKGILNKVVSQDIAKEILSGQIHLGGEEKKVTVLFADIRNFTAMTEAMHPAEVIDLLNTCMTKISACVDDQGGVIDKYVGDEAMALFGAPVSKEDSALRAVKSAFEMVDVLKQWNLERKSQGFNPVEMGIGIHTGEVLVGNMGAENRLNYTVIGSNVNLAARICSQAKGMEILISKQTLQEDGVEAAIRYEEMAPIPLKGFAAPVILYRAIEIKT
jgi:class 3 adenylate cyclase